MRGTDDVEEYILRQAESTRRLLRQIRRAILQVAPGAKEKMSYGMLFYEYRFSGFRGRLAYLGAYKNHVSLQPLPHHIPADLEKKLSPYRSARSTLRFPLGSEAPVALITKLVKLRRDEIDGGL